MVRLLVWGKEKHLSNLNIKLLNEYIFKVYELVPDLLSVDAKRPTQRAPYINNNFIE